MYLASAKAIEYGIPLLPDKYDTQQDSLEENLYVISVLNGINHPMLKDWKTCAYKNDELIVRMKDSF